MIICEYGINVFIEYVQGLILLMNMLKQRCMLKDNMEIYKA